MIHTSVHIGNNIFKITEDAKQLLESYRVALYEHLKNFNNSGIIIKELEYKLSELLLPYIDNEFDFLTEDDVKQAILIIGLPDGYTIPDLQNKVEEEEYYNQSIYEGTVTTLSEKFKHLYRDIDRQQIGGVAAGIADILRTDPLWIRMLLILPIFLLGTTKIPLAIVCISYLIGWLLLPEKRNIKRDPNTKIFFRDKENKMIGGIASGLSNYLNMEVTWLRLGLIGLSYMIHELIIVYIVTWIVTPYSRSLKDKFQSKGVQFNLNEIETYLTKTFEKTNFSGEYFGKIYKKVENTNINVSPLLYKLWRALSFIFGCFLFISTIITIITTLPFIAVSLKFVSLSSITSIISEDFGFFTLMEYDKNFLNTFQDSIPNTFAIISTLEFTAAASLMIALSITLMAFKKVLKNTSWVGLVISNVVLLVLMLTALNMSVYNIDNQASHKEEVFIPINGGPINIKLNKLGHIDANEVDIHINSYEGDKVKMVFFHKALGKTREDAIRNAKAIDYLSSIHDNDITLGSHFSFPRGAKYRYQELSLYVYIPQMRLFTIDEVLQARLKNQDLAFDQYNQDEFLMFDRDDLCQTVQNNPFQLYTNPSKKSAKAPRVFRQRVHTTDRRDHNSINFQIHEGFDTLRLNGNLNVQLKVADRREKPLIILGKSSTYHYKNENGVLSIYPFNKSDEKNEQLTITVPKNIKAVEFKGNGTFNLSSSKSDSLKIDLDGNIDANVCMNTELLYTILQGSSVLNISGSSSKAYIFANDGSKIEGKKFNVNELKAKAKGVSKIEMTAKESAIIFQSPLSKVTILGEPLHFEKHTQR